MPLKNRILPIFILAFLFLIKCKDSPTQSNAPTRVAEQTSVTEVDAFGSAPEQVSPSDTASEVARRPKFTWKAVDGADGYQLDASHGNQEVIHQRVDKANFTPDTALLGETTYYWRVRAIHDGTEGEWSEIHSFTTIDSLSEQLAAPQQMTPSDKKKAVARRPKFTWKAIDGADGYQLDASHGKQEVIHQRVDKANFTPEKALLGGTTYYWRVRAIDGGTKEKWSEIHSFTTTANSSEQLAAPEQMTPADKKKAVSRKPKFTWKPVDGAKEYQLDASHGSQTVLHERVDEANFTPKEALTAKTTYYWRVRAIAGDTDGKWSEVQSFTTTITNEQEDAISTELQSPKNNAEGRPVNVKLQWKKVKGASKYKVQLAHGEQFKSLAIDKSIEATSYKTSDLDHEENYTWRVMPVVADQPTEWSEVGHFKTRAKSNASSTDELAAPEQAAPSDKKKAVSRKPKFKWKAVDGAKEYQLDASHGNQTIIHQRVDKANFTPRKALSAKTTYYWRVRAIAGETDGKWSEVQSFTTAAKEGDSTPAVSLRSPDDGASDQPLDLSLRWQSLAGISQYRVQVAPGSGFSRPVTDETTGSTTYNLSGLGNNQTYYWRVQAAGDGNSSNWSTARSFRTKAAVQNDGSSSSRASSDQQALMDLYKATGGDNWTHNRGWGDGAPSNSWYGVKVNGRGRVTRVDLFKNNLRGHLPKSIGNLDKVTYLNVKNNHLTGKIPSEIGDMASLKTLILQGRTYEIGGLVKEPSDDWTHGYHPGKHLSNTNDLSGRIPSTIGNLSNLIILEIANAPNIKGPIPSEIGNLSKLKGLYLSFDDFSGTTLPSSIGNLTNLKNLYIAGAALEGSIPASFQNLTQLTQINLAKVSSHNTGLPSNHLTGNIPDFSNFTELRGLSLSENDLDGGYPSYLNNGNFKKLRTLNIAHNNLTGTLPNFNNLQSLQSLTLSGNKLTGSIDAFTTLPDHIQIISAGWNNFSGEFPQSGWPDFYQLKTVYMNNNNLTGDIPCSFWNKLDNPKLNIAKFGNNNFSSTCKSSAQAMKGTGSIDLDL